MAGYAGSVGLTGYIAPADTLDTYALQSEVFNRGGFRSVADTTERDAISADRRKLGMLVYCFSDSRYYTLKNGITNADWEFANFAGGQFIDLSDTPNTHSSTQFRYLMNVVTNGIDGIEYSYNYGADWKYLQAGDNIMTDATSHVNMNNFNANGEIGYLPYIDYFNGKLQGMILLVMNTSQYDLVIMPQDSAIGGGTTNDKLRSSSGSNLASLPIKSGEVMLFSTMNDDPQDWYHLATLGGGSTAEKHFEDIPSDSSIVEEGYYFVYGSNTELTINDDLTNRVFNIKSIGTTILKTENGIIDGVTQDINMNAGDAITIIAKDDDTYLILNKF